LAITDSSGRVLAANPAFEALCAAGTQGPVHGRDLAELLGDPRRSLAAVLAEARRLGIAEQKHAVIGSSTGSGTMVEVSAALLAEGDQECIGLTLRRIDHGSAASPQQLDDLAVLIDQLANQVGPVGLSDLLLEASDLVERHLIRVALARTLEDVPQASQLLGIDIDALRLRMRLLGIEPDGPEDEAPAPLLN
jgi:DNA-binding NtrC family response regulator